MAHSARFLPMQTAGTHHFIERTYREGSQFQWVRETYANAIQAGAKHIEFGIEWQAVENLGVYRRVIADDGCGMTGDQLTEFFNTFGGGGKPIGGAHENFGVGAKTSLLPWNHYGMLVISWVKGDASMIWVHRDPETEEYGLKLEKCISASGETSTEGVYDPYNDPVHGCDWAAVKPSWIKDHGTVIVLLGNSPTTNTVEGDPSRSESDLKGISSFLNRRMWTIPDDVEVYVDELRNEDRSLWPTTESIAHGPVPKVGLDRRTNPRQIRGAKFFIEYPEKNFEAGSLKDSSSVSLKDGTVVHWYLWEGDRPKVHSYAAIGGYIATLYDNELYDISSHHSTYRSFGVSEGAIRNRLWLIIEPLVDPDGKRGVYPKTDRNSLLIKGGPTAGEPLPLNDWAGKFADKMPVELLRALASAQQGMAGTIDDEAWRDRLADRFGSRWRIPRVLIRPDGEQTAGEPSDEAQPPRKSKNRTSLDTDTPTEASGAPTERSIPRAKTGGAEKGDETRVPGGIPAYQVVGPGDGVGENMIAAWQPNHPKFPEGVVLLNASHPVIRKVVEHWQAQYPDHYAEQIANAVIAVYGEVAVAKIAHSAHLKRLIPTPVIEKSFRSEEALTMSLLGLVAEEQMISTRVGGRFHKKRLAVERPRKVIPR